MRWNGIIQILFVGVCLAASRDSAADKLNELEAEAERILDEIRDDIQQDLDAIESWMEPWFEDVGNWLSKDNDAVDGMPMNMDDYPDGFWYGTQNLMCVFQKETERKWVEDQDSILENIHLPDSVIDKLREIPG